MKRLISFPLESGGTVQVEVEEETGLPVTRGLHPADVVGTVATSFEAALEAIKPAALAMASIFRNIADAPDAVEVEFGVTTEGKLKVVVAGGERDIKGAHMMKLVFKPTP